MTIVSSFLGPVVPLYRSYQSYYSLPRRGGAASVLLARPTPPASCSPAVPARRRRRPARACGTNGNSSAAFGRAAASSTAILASRHAASGTMPLRQHVDRVEADRAHRRQIVGERRDLGERRRRVSQCGRSPACPSRQDAKRFRNSSRPEHEVRRVGQQVLDQLSHLPRAHAVRAHRIHQMRQRPERRPSAAARRAGSPSPARRRRRAPAAARDRHARRQPPQQHVAVALVRRGRAPRAAC